MHRHRTWWRASLAWAGVVLGLGGAAWAQLPAGNVTVIAVEPSPGRTSGALLPRIEQPVGQPLQRQAVQASIQALFATGEFADVRALAYPEAAGLKLVFATRPNYFVADVRVTGSPDPPTASELADAGNIAIGALYTPAQSAKAAEAIRQRLRSYGYYQARVTPQVQLDAATAQATLIFHVAPGAVARAGAIHFAGNRLFSDAVLRRAGRFRTGAPVTRDRLDGWLSRLQAFYAQHGRLGARISAQPPHYDAATNRLEMNIHIEAGPLVQVRVEGMKLGASTLRRQLPIYQEHAADLELVEEGRANLQNYLQRQGYFAARVSFVRRQQSAGGGGALQIIYHIIPGPREVLDAVTFSGNHYFDAADLLDRVQVRAASRWPPFVASVHGLYSSALASEDADTITQLYQNNGFASVTVTPRVRPDAGQPHRLTLTFQIEEGAQTRVGTVRIEGTSAAQRAALLNQLRTASGQPYAPGTVAADRAAILTYFYNAGFQQAQCTVQTADAAPPDAATAVSPRRDITFAVVPGPMETIHRVYITGNQHVHRNVVAHRLALEAGQPLSQLSLLDGQRALYNSGLFTSATVAVRNPAGSENAKDIYVAVHEAERYTFSEGVGLQVQGGTGGTARDILGKTGYSPLLSFDVTRTAVTGRAQTLALRTAYGTLQKRALLSYSLPEFLNHAAWQAQVNTFYDDTFDVRTFRAIREQAGVQLTDTLSPYAGWNYDLNFRRVRVLSPEVAPQQIPILSQPVEVAEFAATYDRDHRDNPLDTHRGNFNSLQMAVAKSYGAGFANFGRLDLQNHTYYPFGRNDQFVLARSTRLGIELPFGPQATTSITNPVTGVTTTTTGHLLPLPERFLSGGADSLRGFSINQAGPRDPITGFPVGGEALLVNNVELRFPLLGPTLGGVAFYDLGNVYTTPGALVRSLARLHPDSDGDFTSHTVGFGLRYATPVGPVRVDLGYLLNSPTFQYFSTGTPAQALQQRLPAFHFFFSFGQTF